MEVWSKDRTHLFPQSRAETPMQDPSCTLPARGPQRSPGSPQSPARLVHCNVCTGEQGPTQRINCLCEINNETTESPLCSPDGKDKQSPPAHATPHGPSWGPLLLGEQADGWRGTSFTQSHPSKRRSLLQNAFTGTSVLDRETGGRGSAGGRAVGTCWMGY